MASAKTITMWRVVSLHLIATAVAGAIAAMLGGGPAMLSTVLGGICCVVPNGLFAVRLFAGTQKPGGATAGTFFVWEFIKIALTFALFGAVAWLYRDVNWLAFVAGFIVALKSYIILLFRH